MKTKPKYDFWETHLHNLEMSKISFLQIRTKLTAEQKSGRQISCSRDCAAADLYFMIAEEFELLINEIKHYYIYYWHPQ